jgi:DNA-binding GntR family transcriptional regulator
MTVKGETGRAVPTTPKAKTLLAALEEGPEWERVRPRTLVSQAMDAIVTAAARGVILPGDRIVETDIARALGISRVPIREALRLLESQGVVISEPYRGMRLMPLTGDRLEKVIEVRVVLETVAARRAIALGRNSGNALRALSHAVDELELMAIRRDLSGLAHADASFHRELCRLSGNEVLCSIWEPVALQMTITVGLSALGKPMQGIVEEHRLLLEAFRSGEAERLDNAIEEHIRVQTDAVDFERIIAERRDLRARRELESGVR